jgi:hypothetical protein
MKLGICAYHRVMETTITKEIKMEIKIINNQSYDFEPQIIAYMIGERLVAEIAFNLQDCQQIERDLGQKDYVIGPLSKTIALTNIASLNDLRKLV